MTIVSWLFIFIIIIFALLGIYMVVKTNSAKPTNCVIAKDPCNGKLPCCDPNYSCQDGTCKVIPIAPKPTGTLSSNSYCVENDFATNEELVPCCDNRSLTNFEHFNTMVVCMKNDIPEDKFYPVATTQKGLTQLSSNACSNDGEQCVPGSQYPCCESTSYCKPDETGSSYCTHRDPKNPPVCTADDCKTITSKKFPVSIQFKTDDGRFYLVYDPNSQETFYMFDNLIYNFRRKSCLTTYNDSGVTFVTYGDYNDPDSNLCGSENNTKFKLNNDYTISTLDGILMMYYNPSSLILNPIVLSADPPSSSWIPLKFIN